jgi:hypothetical protein
MANEICVTQMETRVLNITRFGKSSIIDLSSVKGLSVKVLEPCDTQVVQAFDIIYAR